MQLPTQQQLVPQPNRRNVKIVQVFGILHIITSALIFSFGMVVLIEFNLHRALNAHATPVWSIASFFTTGILGVLIFCKPQNRALVISHNTFAIISVFLATAILIASSFGIKLYNCKTRWHSYNYYSYYSGYTSGYNYVSYDPFECWSKTIRNIGQPIYGILVGLSTLELIFSIVSAVYGFRIFNCCTGPGGCSGGCCDDSRNDCNCCCDNEASTSQMYQLQPVNMVGYQAHQQQLNIMQPQFRQQYPNSTYLQQIANHQINIPPVSNTQQSQIVTSGSGQQFVLMPMSQLQATAPVTNSANEPVVTSTVPSTTMQGASYDQPPKYHDQTVLMKI